MINKTICPLVPASLYLCISAACAQPVMNTPILSGADNFRDLAGITAINGGTGLANPTDNYGVMRTGVFYRTNALSTLTASDQQALAGLGITKVIDLRTKGEYTSAPEVQNVPKGAVYMNIDILGNTASVTPALNTPADSINFMQELNQNFVTNADERAKLAEVFTQLAQTAGAIAYNCTAGKDRTGWVSAVLETIAGVTPTTIMQDYLATNTYTAARVDATLASLQAAYGASYAAAYAPLLGVQASFLQAGYEQMSATYGTAATTTMTASSSDALSIDYQAFDNYLKQGLGLSQADIYVLRAKMVDYQTLPGQVGFSGNAAQGAALLNALQNSPLSGSYTRYNYFLQSAVDAGTLGGMENRVGGQLHADSQSYILRQSLRIDDAIAPYSSGTHLAIGQTEVWQTTLGGYMRVNGSGSADTGEHSTGVLLGATHRYNDNVSTYATLGHHWGSENGNGSSADINTLLGSFGGRYAANLEQGYYVAASFSAGSVDYSSTRILGDGLGTARGNSRGAVYAAQWEVGNIFRGDSYSLTPKLGVNYTHGRLNAFDEQGSELALNVRGFRQDSRRLLAGVEARLLHQQLGSFAITPVLNINYQRSLNNPEVSSHASLYGWSVNQDAAYTSRNLLTTGLGISAQRGAFSVQTEVNTSFAGANVKGGVDGQITLGYRF